MFGLTAERLATRSRLIRYIYHVVTAFRPVRYATWLSEGEPNAFLAPSPPKTRPTRKEVSVLLETGDVFALPNGRKTLRRSQLAPRSDAA